MQKAFWEIFTKKRKDAEVKAEVVGERPCERISGDMAKERLELIRKSKELITDITGKAVEEIPCSTDCNIPLSLGIPAVCFGTCYGAGAHTREEYVLKDSLKYGYKIALASVLRYVKEGRDE